MDKELNIYIGIVAIVLFGILILVLLNNYLPFPNIIKKILSFLIIIGLAYIVLTDLGLMDSVIKSVSDRIDLLTK
jgi:hypothetical protein